MWIVDDSPLQGETFRQALASEYELSLYETGAAMLEDLASLPPPDAIVLDWHMPDLTGIDICRFVRAIANLAQLPILLVTASGSSERGHALRGRHSARADCRQSDGRRRATVTNSRLKTNGDFASACGR